MDSQAVRSTHNNALYPLRNVTGAAHGAPEQTPPCDEVVLTPSGTIPDKQSAYPAHIPSELLIRYNGEMPDDMTFKNISLRLIKNFDLPDTMKESSAGALCHVAIESGQSVDQAIELLQKDGRVAYVEPNYLVTTPRPDVEVETPDIREGTDDPSEPDDIPQNRPNDLHDQSWGLHNYGQTGGISDADIDAPEAWYIATGDREKGPIIAVIDTGVDYAHPDLKNNIWANPGEIPGDGKDNDNNGVVDDIHGFDALSDGGDPMDHAGHGTHCAGIIGAEGDNDKGIAGVNWKARIMPIRIMNTKGVGTLAATVDGLFYATKNGARIASNSWVLSGYSHALKDAIKAYPGLFVAAAGNKGSDNDKTPQYPASYDLPNIISVAATNDRDGLAGYSCFGKKSVDLGAPGDRIYSTYTHEGYQWMSGTSMATPHVAGAAALIMTAEPELTIEQVRDRLFQSVDPLPALKDKVSTGGRLNAYKALKKNDAPPPAAP